MTQKAHVKEIFTSIQGEGPYVGVKQLFIRFCGCNLKCEYCDTVEEQNENLIELSPQELKESLQDFNLKTIHSISLTGGEPLLWSDFLAEFLPLTENKIYLETNATLRKGLVKIIDYVNIISADIKLPSASGIENSFALHDEFFKAASQFDKELFVKIVFDENILDDEIYNCIKLAEKYNFPLILQPKTTNERVLVGEEKIFEVHNKFLAVHANTRVIPQIHKFLQVR